MGGFFDLVAYLGRLAGAMLAIGSLAAAVFVKPFRHWIAGQIDAAINRHRDEDHE